VSALFAGGSKSRSRAGHLVLGRVDEDGPDPRFRLTPLGDSHYGLSLYDRNRWDPLPYAGTLNELVDVLNNDLGAWAAPWTYVPSYADFPMIEEVQHLLCLDFLSFLGNAASTQSTTRRIPFGRGISPRRWTSS
jgi:hypothetical protein